MSPRKIKNFAISYITEQLEKKILIGLVALLILGFTMQKTGSWMCLKNNTA